MRQVEKEEEEEPEVIDLSSSPSPRQLSPRTSALGELEETKKVHLIQMQEKNQEIDELREEKATFEGHVKRLQLELQQIREHLSNTRSENTHMDNVNQGLKFRFLPLFPSFCHLAAV